MDLFGEYGPAPPPPKPKKPAVSNLSQLLAYNQQVQFKSSGAMLESTNEVTVRMQGVTKSILKRGKEKAKVKKKIKFNEDVQEIEFEKDNIDIFEKKPFEEMVGEEDDMEEDEEEIIAPRKTFDFKREFHKQEQSTAMFPESFGRRPTILQKPRTSNLTRKENEILTEFKTKYGKGAGMFMKQGGSLGKGLGKFEQGRVDPVEAVRKNQYLSREDAKLQKLLNKGKVEDKVKDKERKVEKEKEKHWKVNQKRKEKKEKMQKQGEINQKKAELQKQYIPQKTLDISYTSQELTTKQTMKSLSDYQPQPQNISNQKVIDMTGTQARYFENYQALKTIVNDGEFQGEETNCKEYRLLGDMVVSLKYERERISQWQQKIERDVEENEIDNLEYELKGLQEEQRQLQNEISETENLKQIIPKLRQWRENNEPLETVFLLLDNNKFDIEMLEKLLNQIFSEIRIQDVCLAGKEIKQLFAPFKEENEAQERVIQRVMGQVTKKIEVEWNPVEGISLAYEVDD